MAAAVLFAALIAPLLSGAQQVPPRDAAPKANVTGTAVITGRVLAGQTDRGVSAAVVYLTTEPMTSDPQFALTDRTGRFTFDKLPAGTYRISVMPPEHSGRFVFSDDRVAPIDLGVAQTVEIPPVRLPFGASVSGQVVDDRGEPMANVEVYAFAEQPGNPQRERVGSPFCRTDDLGRYRLFGLRAGNVLVVATAENSMLGSDSAAPARLVRTYFPDAVTESEASPVTLRFGTDVEGIDIRMSRVRTFRVSGTVTDSRGMPYRGELGFRRRTADGSSTTSIPIKGEGSFEVTGVVPGSYAIVAGSFTGGPFERENAKEYANLPFEVTEGDVEGLTVVTKPTVDLTVHVEFEPEPPSKMLPDFGIFARSVPDGAFYRQALIENDSSVLLKQLGGPVLLRPILGDPTRAGWFLKGIFLGTRDITDTPVEFTAADAKRVRLVLTNGGGTVAGTISDEKGAPVRDQAVVLFPVDRSRWTMESTGVLSGRSDKDGRYMIRGVRAGQYRIAAIDRAGLSRLYTDRASLLESLFDAATPVTVGEDEQRQVDLRLVR